MDVMNVEEYKTWIGGIARRYRQSQIKAATAVNVEMLKFYWSLGADIVLERFIPADFKSQMPTIEEVEGELTRRMEIADARKLDAKGKCNG